MNFLADTPRLEICRLAGIPVRVDITFALVPIFLFGILQQAPFEIAGPAYATIIAGVFLSVLLHELGHATVARLLGVPVGEILVGGFYGYARMLETPRSTAANVAILVRRPPRQWRAVSDLLELARMSRDHSQRLFRPSSIRRPR